MSKESDRPSQATGKRSTTLRVQEQRLTGYLQGLDLRKDLLQLLEAGHQEVIVDMSAVELISSSIIGTLIGVNRDFWGRNARIVLSSLHPQVREILTTTGVDGLFKIRDA